MVNGRVKLPNIHLQAILGTSLIPQCPLNGPEGPVNASSLYTGICISRETRHQNGLYDKHNSPMDDPIREIGESEYFSLFWLSNGENVID